MAEGHVDPAEEVQQRRQQHEEEHPQHQGADEPHEDRLMLSLDNVFVFQLIFTSYKTPPEQTHKAVFVGLVGALVLRMLFFMLLSTLLHLFGWIHVPFGL